MTSISRIKWVFVVFLCLAVPAAAQIPMPGFIIPVVVKAPGLNDSNWATDLFITNVGDSNAVFSAHFFPEKVENTFDGTFAKTNIMVAKGRTLHVTDVIGSWFPSQGTNTKGWMLLAETTPTDCNSDDRVLASAIIATRVYNSVGGGATYGMVVEASVFSINASPFPSVFTGIRHQGSAKPGFRTSVGVANISTTWTNVQFTLYNHAGAVVGQTVKDVKPLSMKQWTLDQLGFAVLGNNGGRLEVSIVDPTFDPCGGVDDSGICLDTCSEECDGAYSFGPFKAIVPYVSNTDNLTGDGETILPVVDQLEFYTWANQYVETNCPDEEAKTLLEQMMIKVSPYVEGSIQAPPVFRKVVD